MRSSAPFLALVLALAAPLAAPLAAGAQPDLQNGETPGGARQIQINRCDPRAQYATSPAYPGFVPGFYPRGPFYWGDAWGYRYYQEPLVADQSGVLYLDYVNVGTKVARTIDFGLLANGHLVAEVRDVGTFSPNAEIKHQFGLNPNVFPISTGLPVCIPLRIVYSDGMQWRNPRLPALRRELYGPMGPRPYHDRADSGT